MSNFGQPQMEAFEGGFGEFEYGQHEYGQFEGGGVFSHEAEMELAHELLSVNSEAELNHFLGKLISRAGSAIGQAVRSPQGQAIGGALKTAARQAITTGAKAGGESLGGAAGQWGGQQLGAWAGNKLGGLVGAQGWGDKGRDLVGGWGKSLGTTLGGKIGSGLGNMAANALGLEAEYMEQGEFELAGAQQFVRLAGEVTQQTLGAAPNVPPQAAVQSAMTSAARQLAPGLLGGGGSRPRAGRWVRRGRTITLFGV